MCRGSWSWWRLEQSSSTEWRVLPCGGGGEPAAEIWSYHTRVKDIGASECTSVKNP